MGIFLRGKTGRGMLLTTSAKVKNEIFCSCTSLFVFMAWTGTPFLLQYNKKIYPFKTVPRSVILHNPYPFFPYKCVQTHSFLHNIIKTALVFLRILVFPRKIFKLCSPARVQNILLPHKLLKATFVFLPRMCSKSLFSPELTPKRHCSIHNLLKVYRIPFSRMYSKSFGFSHKVLKLFFFCIYQKLFIFCGMYFK